MRTDDNTLKSLSYVEKVAVLEDVLLLEPHDSEGFVCGS